MEVKNYFDTPADAAKTTVSESGKFVVTALAGEIKTYIFAERHYHIQIARHVKDGQPDSEILGGGMFVSEDKVEVWWRSSSLKDAKDIAGKDRPEEKSDAETLLTQVREAIQAEVKKVTT